MALDAYHINIDNALSSVLGTVTVAQNACQAMPQGGELRVAAWTDEARICFSIADQGVGIAEDQLLRIFEPYVTTKPKGSGLGLALVAKIVSDWCTPVDQHHCSRLHVAFQPVDAGGRIDRRIVIARIRDGIAADAFVHDRPAHRPLQGKALGHDIACHGLKWIHYRNVDEATERAHMAQAMQIIQDLTGERPLGWYTGRDSPNTRRLVADFGGFEYDSDYYGDDLPFWLRVRRSDGTEAPHLVVPYTLDANDMRFATPQGFNTGDHFFDYLRDAFDVLYAEGDEAPKMLSIGMHCRLLGRPARFRALQRFLDYVQSHDKVWVCRRIDIAQHWMQNHPYAKQPVLSTAA